MNGVHPVHRPTYRKKKGSILVPSPDVLVPQPTGDIWLIQTCYIIAGIVM